MKRLLLIAPCGEKANLSDGSLDEKYSPPLGLLYIGTTVKDVGTVKIIDAYNRNYADSEILDQASTFNPDIIGISINFFFSMKPAIRLLKKLRLKFKNAIIICGGNAATYTHEDLLKEGFDYVSMYEGENTYKDIVLSPTKDLTHIKGLSYLRESCVYTSKRGEIIELDSLPFPDYSLLDGYQDYFVAISSSRGCPYDCFYCSTKQMWGTKWRRRSAESIYNELVEQSKLYKSDDRLKVAFSDDNFLVDKKRFLRLSELFEEGNIKCDIGFSARIELVTKEILEKAKQIGVRSMFFGVESGSSRMLQKLDRKYTKEDVVEVVKQCADVGINVTTSFMVGIPGENANDVEDTFSLIRNMPAADIQVHVCTALPGTDMWNNPSKYGITSDINKENIGDIDHGASFDTQFFSRESIDEIYMKAYALKSCKTRIRVI